MDAVCVENMTKSYDGVKNAVNNMSFTIPKGEIFGFLGPNGSGKTTTVRLINGILAPTSGRAMILGKDTLKNAAEIHDLSGVMTETASCYENLTGEENLFFFGKMHNLSIDQIKKRSKYLLKRLELYDARDRKVKGYSTGMRKRISFAIALIHNPEVLFLDEPTSGLDPESALNVTRMIKAMAVDENVTIFLCTHQLKYAQDICTLYGFINEGRMLGFGSFDELTSRKNAKTYLRVRGENIPDGLGFQYEGEMLYRKGVSADNEVSELLYNILKSGGRVYEAVNVKWDLEDLYFSYVRGENNE